MRHIVLCDNGAADTLAAIPALADRYGAGVVTVTVDVGQDGTSTGWRERARAAGAVRTHVLDARDEFARDYILPALHACAMDDDVPLQGAALYRALVADKLVDVAGMEGASVVAHGFDPHADQAVELERLILARRPDLVVVAAQSVSDGGGQSAMSERQRVPELRGVEANLWWRRAVLDRTSPPSGAAPDPSSAPRHLPGVRAGLFTVTPPESCGPGAATVEILFKEGMPVSTNGIDMPLVELIEVVDTIAGDHGVGRTVTAADECGTACVTITEAPAARVLRAAYTALARAIESPSLWRLHRQLGRRYAVLLRGGEWHSDTRRAIDAFACEARSRISGTVRVALRRGRCTVVKGSVRAEESSTRHVGVRPGAPAREGHDAPPPPLPH